MAETTPIIVVGAMGRMGRIICALARESADFALAGVVDRAEQLPASDPHDLPAAESLAALLPRLRPAGAAAGAASGDRGPVIIDFTAPEVSLATARTAATAGLPVVIGTTGLNGAQKAELDALARSTPLFWSSNMSVGVNVLRRLLPQLAAALGPDYDMEMVEIHHRRKKDAPSGTALTLAEGLAEARGWDAGAVRCSCRDGLVGERPGEQIGVMAVRGGDVVGVHSVYFLGPGERIEVTHEAHSRENFARGALRAAAWLARQKPGRLYSMPDVLGPDVLGPDVLGPDTSGDSHKCSGVRP